MAPWSSAFGFSRRGFHRYNLLRIPGALGVGGWELSDILAYRARRRDSLKPRVNPDAYPKTSISEITPGFNTRNTAG